MFGMNEFRNFPPNSLRMYIRTYGMLTFTTLKYFWAKPCIGFHRVPQRNPIETLREPGLVYLQWKVSAARVNVIIVLQCLPLVFIVLERRDVNVIVVLQCLPLPSFNIGEEGYKCYNSLTMPSPRLHLILERRDVNVIIVLQCLPLPSFNIGEEGYKCYNSLTMPSPRLHLILERRDVNVIIVIQCLPLAFI